MTQDIVSPSVEEESAIRDFLLGKVAEADRERLEERLLTDRAFSELVSAMEEELIDAYTAGLLRSDERDAFETRFLVTEERRRRVRFSQALAHVRVAKPGEGFEGSPSLIPLGRRGWMQVAAAVTTVALGSAAWMSHVTESARAELQAAEERIAELQQSREALLNEHRRQLAEAEARGSAMSRESEEPTRAPRPVVVALLGPGVLRDAASSVPSLRVSPSTLLVELRLELAEDTHPTYAASVHNASGAEILRFDDLRAIASSERILLSIQVAADYLPEGDYSVRLSGRSPAELEELDRYYVRIVTP